MDSIIWPNPEFDNNITVYGPQVISLVRRYLAQMLDELRALPHPDGAAGSLLDSVDLIVPHQANKTMVVNIAQAAGVAPERLYFDIEHVGNTSSATIPIALHDAVHEGVIGARCGSSPRASAPAQSPATSWRASTPRSWPCSRSRDNSFRTVRRSAILAPW